ncbi:hypothetical protein [Niabella hibiscisoli]|uniref:hypothetical protein n=1 Tax=Niabella hibiscisoli TaxID=1825928 RepID=UPI001F10CA1F|nr:hypothetical protein [Niabella hibiscisoli]MCH5720432.1 hypothetical protein [Niabella hibiscisoli]
MIAEYQKRLNANALISIADNGEIKLFDILRSFRYDDGSLSKGLEIYRNGESDFIKVVFTSENPQLSTYVVNTLSGDFINYYTNIVTTNQQQSIASLDTILKAKQNEMVKKNAQLLNSSAGAASNAANAMSAQQQADVINQQINEAESQRTAVVRNISSLKGALNEVNNKLAGSGGYVSSGSTSSASNSDIVSIDNQISMANARYVNNNFQPQDKATLDSLQRIKSRLLSSSGDKGSSSAAAGIRQSLLNDKIRLENDLAAANSMLTVVEQQLASLGPRRAGGSVGLVNNAGQAALARDADLATKEYSDVQTQFEQTSMLARAGIQLNISEPGLPQPPNPSKGVLYLGLSGVSSFMICLLTLLIVFMLNTTINTPDQLKSATGQKVLGCLNLINEENKDLRDIWKNTESVNDYMIYRDLLRSLRFELNEELSNGNNVLGITSFADGEGKSFLAGSLSYAFAMMGKNVLLICENHQGLTSLVTNNSKQKEQKQNQVFESFLVKKEIQIEDRITILNRNQANSNSLLELKDVKSLFAGFKVLKETFDIVIMDIDSSQEMHNVKEWMMFTDKSIAVFGAGNKIAASDMNFLKYLSSEKGFLGWVMNKVKITENT